MGGSDYQIRYCSASPNIHSAQGALVSALERFDTLSLQRNDFICIPGIDFQSFKSGDMDSYITRIEEWLVEQQRRGVHLGSICSGALILAKAGILDRVQCTTHWKCIDYLKRSFPKTHVQEKRLYCFDQGVFTSAGMTAGIDMALALVEQWDSPLIAARVAQEMVINVRRADFVEQRNIFLDFKNHFNADVYKAQEILAVELRSNYGIDDLARRLNLSPRHLARLFKHHTGESIQIYRDRVRVDLGEQLLKHSEKSIKEIAFECGFQNSRQFIRLWKKVHLCTPSTYRMQMKGKNIFRPS